MAKIDVSSIDGYENMTAEEKIKTLEAFEYNDNSTELEKYKSAASKANSEAASWKKKHNELLSEDERKKQEQADSIAQMQKELDELREGKKVSEYKAKFIAQGYDETLAEETAKAMAEGNSEQVFANNQKFLDDYAKRVKADALKKTPRPAPGQGGNESVNYDERFQTRRRPEILRQLRITRALKLRRRRKFRMNKGENQLWQILLLQVLGYLTTPECFLTRVIPALRCPRS